jgi:hypothetical protein
MISESDVVTIVKSYIANLLENSEHHKEHEFISFPKENFHLDNVIFSEMNRSNPQEYANYLNEYAAFCSYCNCVPNDADQLNPSAFTLSLHEKYKYILDNCILHSDVLTDTEKVQLKEAVDFLYQDDGVTPSDVYIKYIQIVEELYALQDQLASDAIAAKNMPPEEQANWENNAKKLLDDKIKLVKRRLTVEGQQAKVESSIETVDKMHQKDPALIVDSLRQRISELEEQHGLGLASTPYLPIQPSPEFHDIEVWQQATIPQQEIARIVKQSRNAEISPETVSDLTQIDVSWSSVYLSRDWLDSTFFASTYWTMPGNAVVSHGARPNSGILPAYVKRVVITNDISYKVRTKTKTSAPSPTSRVTSTATFQPSLRASLPSSLAFRPRAATNLTAASSMSGITKLKVTSLARPKQLTPQLQTSITQVMRAKTQFAVSLKHVHLKEYQALRSLKFAPPKANMTLETHEVDFENPLMLAFVCRRVPRSPSRANT